MCNSAFWEEYEAKVREWLPAEVSGNATFYRDGIVGDEFAYKNEIIRPLFLLKEVDEQNDCTSCTNNHNCPARIGSNTVDFCKCSEGFACGKSLWGQVAKLEQILLGTYPNCNDHTIQHSAIINLKKIGGGKSVDSPKSLRTLFYSCHAAKFVDMLRKQIMDIDPTIIVCGGTYSAINNTNLFDGELNVVQEFEALNGLRKAYLWINNDKPSQNTTIIDMIHPKRLGYSAFCEAINQIRG